MRFLRKILSSKEVRAALAILDEASYMFDHHHGYLSGAYQLVRDIIEQVILDNPSEFTQVIRNGKSPREYIYSDIANTAGDLLESGQYHIRRGHLNPIGPGEDLWRLFNAALDELVRIGAIEPKVADEEKAAILKNIGDAG